MAQCRAEVHAALHQPFNVLMLLDDDMCLRLAEPRLEKLLVHVTKLLIYAHVGKSCRCRESNPALSDAYVATYRSGLTGKTMRPSREAWKNSFKMQNTQFSFCPLARELVGWGGVEPPCPSVINETSTTFCSPFHPSSSKNLHR